MKNILVVCPLPRDYCELSSSHIASSFNLIFHQHDGSLPERILCKGVGWVADAFDPEIIIDQMFEQCEQEKIDGVISSCDYPGILFASIVAQQAGLLGPLPEHVLLFNHKYYSRLAQLKYVPEATPYFILCDPYCFNASLFDKSFPVFIKPVKSFFSVFANVAVDMDDLRRLLKTSILPMEFLEQFNWFMQNYTPYDLDANFLLIEDALTGVQATLEGFVHGGDLETTCIVDSIMFPGTICFKRFEYPSSLPQSVQERMTDIARRLMGGVGFDNGFFNIEFMYNPDTDALHIIEINPRMASQFADLVEKVDGVNTYSLLLDLAVGKKPTLIKKKGKHGIAASFVLRIFEDREVVTVPLQEELEHVYELFPDARIQIHVKAGQKLSDEFQDGKSFRYGLIHLGGRDRQDLFDKFDECRRLLRFQFAPVGQ